MNKLIRWNLDGRMQLDTEGHLMMTPNANADAPFRIAPGFWMSLTPRLIRDTLTISKAIVTSMDGRRVCVLIAQRDHIAAWFTSSERNPLFTALEEQIGFVQNLTHGSYIHREIDAPEITLSEILTLVATQERSRVG